MTGDGAESAALRDDAKLVGAYAEILKSVDGLPSGATGALTFGTDGVILVERKRVCWALASDTPRLTDILCRQQEPPLPRRLVEDVYRRCKIEQKPFGEALLASGAITEKALRAALSLHSGEAIARLAQGGRAPTRFSNHLHRSYDPRFAFSTAELLAAFGARQVVERAGTAQSYLAEVTVPDTMSFAFLRAELTAPLVIAVGQSCELRVEEILEVGAWAANLFELGSIVDPTLALVAANWCERTAVVSWRHRDLGFAAICASRPASSLLVSELKRRFEAQRGLPSIERRPGEVNS